MNRKFKRTAFILNSNLFLTISFSLLSHLLLFFNKVARLAG